MAETTQLKAADAGIWQAFQPLYDDILPENAFNKKKPLLAHYTTVATLEKILTNNEVWFSNRCS